MFHCSGLCSIVLGCSGRKKLLLCFKIVFCLYQQLSVCVMFFLVVLHRFHVSLQYVVHDKKGSGCVLHDLGWLGWFGSF